jgi:RNA polymerase sigma-70 factor (ECF subfamily)
MNQSEFGDLIKQVRAMYGRFSDAELAEQVRDSDSAGAFGELMHRWRGRLSGYFRPLLADDAAVEDAVQEVFCRLWSRRAEYRATGRFEAYLFSLAKHHWLNERRRTARRATEPLTAEPVDKRDDPARLAMASDERQRAAVAVRSLPAGQRDVWRLICEDGLTERQAAARLGVPHGTIKSRLYTARRTVLAACEEMDDA